MSVPRVMIAPKMHVQPRVKGKRVKGKWIFRRSAFGVWRESRLVIAAMRKKANPAQMKKRPRSPAKSQAREATGRLSGSSFIYEPVFAASYLEGHFTRSCSL